MSLPAFAQLSTSSHPSLSNMGESAQQRIPFTGILFRHPMALNSFSPHSPMITSYIFRHKLWFSSTSHFLLKKKKYYYLTVHNLTFSTANKSSSSSFIFRWVRFVRTSLFHIWNILAELLQTDTVYSQLDALPYVNLMDLLSFLCCVFQYLVLLI